MCFRNNPVLAELRRNCNGFAVLFAVLFFQLVSFFAFLLLSVGCMVVLTRVYEFLTSGSLPCYCEAFVTVYLVSIFAEAHILLQRECIGNALKAYYIKYSLLLPIGTGIVYSVSYFLSFVELYIQFEAAHSFEGEGDELEGSSHFSSLKATHPKGTRQSKSDVGNSSQTMPEKLHETVSSSEYFQWHNMCFMLALSCFVYCTTKLIQADILGQLRRITNQTSCIHFVVVIGFLGVHAIMNLLYSIPLVMVGYSLRMYETTGPMSFAQLNIVGMLSGMVFAVLETRRPWPTTTSKKPFFLYENNSRAKGIFGQIQLFLPLFFYYRPFSKGKIELKAFNAANEYVLSFCLAVAFCVLHYSKTLTFINIQKELNRAELVNVNGEREGEELDDEDDLDMVILDLDNRVGVHAMYPNDDHAVPVPGGTSPSLDPNTNCQKFVVRQQRDRNGIGSGFGLFSQLDQNGNLLRPSTSESLRFPRPSLPSIQEECEETDCANDAADDEGEEKLTEVESVIEKEKVKVETHNQEEESIILPLKTGQEEEKSKEKESSHESDPNNNFPPHDNEGQQEATRAVVSEPGSSKKKIVQSTAAEAVNSHKIKDDNNNARNEE